MLVKSQPCKQYAGYRPGPFSPFICLIIVNINIILVLGVLHLVLKERDGIGTHGGKGRLFSMSGRSGYMEMDPGSGWFLLIPPTRRA